jgi:hypothetical protein
MDQVGKFSADVNLDRLGDPEPQFTCLYDIGHLGSTDTRGSIGRGMRVCTDDQFARPDEAFLDHDLVANPGKDIIEVLHVQPLGKLPTDFLILGIRQRRRRNPVIENDHELLRIPYSEGPFPYSPPGEDRAKQTECIRHHGHIDLCRHIFTG